MKTQFDWQGDEGETNNKSAWADFAPLSPYLGTLLWPSAWGVTCFCFCVATYYKSVYIPFEDLHYSVQSVGVLALFCLLMTYLSSKPEKFYGGPAGVQLRLLLRVFGAVFFLAGSMAAGGEVIRASWPTAEGTLLRHLKRRGVTVLEFEFANGGERTLGRCGLVGPARKYTWLNSDFAPGRVMMLRFDSRNPEQVDLNVIVCDRLAILTSMLFLPSILFLPQSFVFLF